MTPTNAELRVQLDGLRDQIATHEMNMVRHFRALFSAVSSVSVAGDVSEMLAKLEVVMANLQETINELRQEVEANRTVHDSVIALIDELLQAVQDHADDPEELQGIIQEIRSQREALATAVERNTPTFPGPTTPEEPIEPDE